jgi:hypothetical protein
MLVFQRGAWHDIEISNDDPMLSDGHRRFLAAAVASGKAFAQAEAALFDILYKAPASAPLRVFREEHRAPQHYKKEARVEKKPEGRGAPAAVRNR